MRQLQGLQLQGLQDQLGVALAASVAANAQIVAARAASAAANAQLAAADAANEAANAQCLALHRQLNIFQQANRVEVLPEDLRRLMMDLMAVLMK